LKYLINLLLIFVINGSAKADDQFFHAQYTLRDTVASQSENSNRQGANLTYGYWLKPGKLLLDVGSQSRTDQWNANKGSYANRLETAATFIAQTNDIFGVYLRSAVGQKFTHITDNAYYSLEAGLRAQIQPELLGRIGYRFRDAFKEDKFDQTQTFRIAAEYSIDQTSVFTFGMDRSYGDSQFIGYNIGYLKKF
jgi:hypothetical protein